MSPTIALFSAGSSWNSASQATAARPTSYPRMRDSPGSVGARPIPRSSLSTSSSAATFSSPAAARRHARQSSGDLERKHDAAVGEQVHHQHQHRDELLARRGDQPRRAARAALRPDRCDASRRAAARPEVYYGAGGFVAHHNTDLWADTVPVDKVGSGLWPMGAAWLSLHLWDHYDFGRDPDFLARRLPCHEGGRPVLARLPGR